MLTSISQMPGKFQCPLLRRMTAISGAYGAVQIDPRRGCEFPRLPPWDGVSIAATLQQAVHAKVEDPGIFPRRRDIDIQVG
jgi:hypothetical protein